MYYNTDTVLFLDGQYRKATESSADLYGQTLHYGYGAFEGIRAYQTADGVRIFKGQEHYDRLINSCNAVNIPLSYTTDELMAISYEVLSRNGFGNAYLRPLVFCSPNMSLSRPNKVHVLICAWEWGAYLGDKLLHLKTSSYCRPHPKSTRIEAKICGHYVNSILATTEAKDAGYDESLLLDSEGFLAEGPGANLFFQRGDKLYTPQLGNILPGITRATVLELCEELNIEVAQGSYLPADLHTADSAFYCGTAAEIIGIASIDNHKLKLEWKDSLGHVLQQAYKHKVLAQEYDYLKQPQYAAQ